MVIYAQDEGLNWHVCGNFADAEGNITFSYPVDGNSEGKTTLTISTNELFTELEEIWRVVISLVPLQPGQTKVSLEPKGGFGLPTG